LAKAIPINVELISHQIVIRFQDKKVSKEYPNTLKPFCLKLSFRIEFSRNKIGIKAMKISRVRPLIGHANPSKIPELRASDK
jgi:hypothetical protein